MVERLEQNWQTFSTRGIRGDKTIWVEFYRPIKISTYERSKGVPVWEAPIVGAKLPIGAVLERELGSPEFPIEAPPKAHVPPLLTIQAQSVLGHPKI